MALVERTQFFVFVAGTDVSTTFASRLISLNVTDNSGETADTCEITLDDTGGHIDLPQQGANITIALGQLGGAAGQVFWGVVDDVTSYYDRGGGRRIQIDGKSAETKGKQKQRRRKHHDKKKVGAALQDAAQFAGVQLTVAPRIANKMREYQEQGDESFLHMAQRYARDYGGTFKMIGGNRGVILDRNAGQSCGGITLGSVVAFAPGNIISAKLSPIITRPRYSNVISRWYDIKKAKWMEEKVQVSQGGAAGGGQESSLFGDADIRTTRGDKTHAKDAAEGSTKESDRDKGAGSVIIDGNPAARAEATCVVVGVRPGIDGSYIIHTAKHDLDRSSGYRTDLELRRPSGDAGKNAAQLGQSGAGAGSGGGGGGAGAGAGAGGGGLPGLYE